MSKAVEFIKKLKNKIISDSIKQREERRSKFFNSVFLDFTPEYIEVFNVVTNIGSFGLMGETLLLQI